jgi:hypothetical protein
MYTVKLIGSNIVHLVFTNQKIMGSTLVRFQEYYENPVYKNNYFEREEFFKWYQKTYKSKYIDDFIGYNFPSSILEDMKNFPHLIPMEKNIIEVLEKQNLEKYYIIASVGEDKKSAFKHEMAHALFYLNEDYRKEIIKIVNSIPDEKLEQMYETLRSRMYDDCVLLDETQAYLIDNVRVLHMLARDWKPWSKQAKDIFKRYTKGVF